MILISDVLTRVSHITRSYRFLAFVSSSGVGSQVAPSRLLAVGSLRRLPEGSQGEGSHTYTLDPHNYTPDPHSDGGLSGVAVGSDFLHGNLLYYNSQLGVGYTRTIHPSSRP